MIRFRVDEVAPAATSAKAIALAEKLGEVLALGGDPAMRVLDVGDVHPLLAAVHAAFAEHRPLVLSPDAVWLTLAQGVAQHVRLNAESLRGRLVRHRGKKTIEVEWSGPFPTEAEPLARIVAAFRAALGAEIGDGRARLLTCDFSTTTEIERTASEIVLLDAMSPYFDLSLACICGIPELTLLGTVDDWRAIRARIDVIAELDLEWWTSSLVPIADRLVAAASGTPDVRFFREIYKPKQAYGAEKITGWIARLFPYVSAAGRYDERNPLLGLPIDWIAPSSSANRMPMFDTTPGITTASVPACAASCLVRVKDETNGERFDVVFEGGVMAVEVDAEGRLAPRAAWTVRKSEGSITAVIDDLRTRADVVVDPVPGGASKLGVPAEILAFDDAVGGARLFVGKSEWRIPPPAERSRVAVPVAQGRNASVHRLVDLADGTILAYYPAEKGLAFVRLRADRTSPVAKGEIDVEGGPTSEHARDVRVVCYGFGRLLAEALRTDGALDFESQETLFDALPAWMKRTR